MTPQEIKDLIASKIAGQGSAVDAGSALPEILSEIVGKLDGGSGSGTGAGFLLIPNDMLDLAASAPSYIATKTEYADFLGITEDEVDALFDWQYPILGISYGSGYAKAFPTTKRPYDGSDPESGVEIQIDLGTGPNSESYFIGFGRSSGGQYIFECSFPGE